MKIYRLKPLSVCETNSYIVASEENNCVLIDAPADPDYILGEIESHGLTLKKIFLTHGHFDHIGAVADLVDRTGCEVYIHSNDASKLSNQTMNLSAFFRMPPVDPVEEYKTLSHNDIIEQDELKFRVMLTAGHSSGSVCYIIDDIIFSGDTLFRLSAGRTDMRDGNFQALKNSLSMLAELNDKPDYVVFPGHGEPTRLSYEKENNQFMQENSDYDGML